MTEEPYESHYDPEQIGRIFRRTAWKCENCGTRISWKADYAPTVCPYCEEVRTFRKQD